MTGDPTEELVERILRLATRLVEVAPEISAGTDKATHAASRARGTRESVTAASRAIPPASQPRRPLLSLRAIVILSLSTVLATSAWCGRASVAGDGYTPQASQ